MSEVLLRARHCQREPRVAARQVGETSNRCHNGQHASGESRPVRLTLRNGSDVHQHCIRSRARGFTGPRAPAPLSFKAPRLKR